MNGSVRLVVAAAAGAVIALVLPRAGLLATTQEIIAFLSLLMAGLLPAMILTATILRGDTFSPKTTTDYGAALRVQLRFWAVLFLLAGLSTIGLVGAKIFSAQDVAFTVAWHRFAFDNDDVAAVFVACAGAACGGVLQRLYPAFIGLRSLLDLNVEMARLQAQARAKAAAEAVESQLERSADSSPYSKFRSAS